MPEETENDDREQLADEERVKAAQGIRRQLIGLGIARCCARVSYGFVEASSMASRQLRPGAALPFSP